MPSYLVVGPPGNWEIGIEKRIWGLPSSSGHMFSQVAQGDFIFFYITAPVKGIVGYGRVKGTKRDRSPVWPEELSVGNAIWPLRIEFDEIEALNRESWEKLRVKSTRKLFVSRSIQLIDDRRSSEFKDGIQNALNDFA